MRTEMKSLVVLAICLAANFGFAQQRYTVADEDAAAPGSPRVVVLRDTVAGAEAAVAPTEGGELSSFRIKFKGQWTELLYHARGADRSCRSAMWPRRHAARSHRPTYLRQALPVSVSN